MEYRCKCVHVHLFEPFDGEVDYYFGSVSAVYDVLNKDVLGIVYTSLQNVLTKANPNFSNKKCEIKIRPYIRKEQPARREANNFTKKEVRADEGRSQRIVWGK